MRLLLPLCVVACTAGGDPADTDSDAPDGSVAPITPYDPLAYVDPFIATGGEGAEVASITPAAGTPNGMTLVGPDTATASGGMLPFYHCAGYHYLDDHVRAFSMVHASGIGIVDQGAVPFLPRNGWDPSDTDPKRPLLRFSHDEEEASAGRYAVRLLDEGVHVEIVATPRGGHVVFRFDEGTDPVVELDLGHTLPDVELRASRVEKGAAGAFSGEHRIGGGYSRRFGGSRTFYAGQFDPAPVGGGVWNDPAAPEDGGTVAEGDTPIGAWWTFPAGTREVHMRLAVSYVDEDGARANLAAELPDVDVAARRAEAEAAWRGRLGGVRVRGGTERERRIFHTSLYRSLLMPMRQDDVDGRYRSLGDDLKTTDHPYYSNLSLWDTFRTVHPWYLLAWPDLQADLDRTLLRMTRDGGSLPRWPMTHGYTGGMVGTPAIQVLAESWHKGVLRDPALVDEAVAVSVRAASEDQDRAGRRAVAEWTGDLGWIPIESGGGGVSHALEYAWSDAALARWLDALGRGEEAARFAAQARNWRNHFDPAVGFNVGRFRDGRFRGAIDPIVWTDDYVEGNAWHYLWMIPWSVQEIIDTHHAGDRGAFLARVQQYWRDVYKEGETIDLFPDDFYWHGNEPVMTTAFLPSLAGDPDTTADAARWILANRYDDTPQKGLDGNDDAGTLSAWALWASIGLFPVAGTPDLAVASPWFERVEIDRAGETLVIRAPGASDAARYVQSATLGAGALSRSVVDHGALIEAGELVLRMGETPVSWQVTP